MIVSEVIFEINSKSIVSARASALHINQTKTNTRHQNQIWTKFNLSELLWALAELSLYSCQPLHTHACTHIKYLCQVNLIFDTIGVHLIMGATPFFPLSMFKCLYLYRDWFPWLCYFVAPLTPTFSLVLLQLSWMSSSLCNKKYNL